MNISSFRVVVHFRAINNENYSFPIELKARSSVQAELVALVCVIETFPGAMEIYSELA